MRLSAVCSSLALIPFKEVWQTSDCWEEVTSGQRHLSAAWCVQLVQLYHKMIAESSSDDEDFMLKTGFHILKPIIKLVDTCSELASTMVRLETLLLPMIEDMCKRKPEDVLDQVWHASC
jgi:hypothetical protein